MLITNLFNVAKKRPPDVIIGDTNSPYMRRWFIIPQNKIINIYLHHFLRSDDDRALHDHPWSNLSILLKGSYTEHSVRPGQIEVKSVLQKGQVKFRISGKYAHRIELTDGECWTLFITGPKYRKWGFHCKGGWVPWNQFLTPNKNQSGTTGCPD